VKVGVLQFFSWPERRVAIETVYERALERIEVMDRTGYDAVWLAEHHFHSFSVCPSVHMLGTMAAARTKRLRIGTAVSLAPFYHPDVTKQAGLDIFHHRSGTREKTSIIETPGSGVALLDYDDDGWLYIYLLNGSTIAAFKGNEPPPRAMLLHNNQDGTFTDVTNKAGVANERWGFGVAVGDYDNDGWPDIYVANFGKNRLYHNNHDGTFTDVAEKAGVTLGGWSTGPTWGDYDHDGRLDLFVPGYVKFDADHPPIAGQGNIPPNFCQFRGIAVMCGPRGLPGERDHLFHNNGDGTFTDVSVKAGVSDPDGYFGLAAVFVDVDDDGWIDLLVANDSTPNYFYRNRHDGTFEDVSYGSGFALSEDGREQASMGIAVGDYNRDGKVDFFTTTFSDDYKTLYRNEGGGNFADAVAGNLSSARQRKNRSSALRQPRHRHSCAAIRRSECDCSRTP